MKDKTDCRDSYLLWIGSNHILKVLRCILMSSTFLLLVEVIIVLVLDEDGVDVLLLTVYPLPALGGPDCRDCSALAVTGLGLCRLLPATLLGLAGDGPLLDPGAAGDAAA